jgi:hypothetical protein
LPAIGRIPMLRRCSLSVRRRPRRSAPSFANRASLQPPWSCAGCSRALRTLSRRESARGRSLAGDRCSRGYLRQDCVPSRRPAPPLLTPHRRRTTKEELLPRLRPQQRHTPRPDASIEDRAGSQPRCPYTAAAGSGTAHSPQHLGTVLAIEARQFRDGEGALSIAPRSEAVDCQEKARQLMQWAGKDCAPLAAGGGIGGSMART